jgi:TolA-binding protein
LRSSSKPAAHAAAAPAPIPTAPPAPPSEEATNGVAGAAAPTSTVTPLESLERERTPAEAPHRASGAAATPVPAASASISDEIRMLDAARRAEASGDSAGAIKALDDYKKQYPRGMLSEESVLLRIQALARLGNRTAARSLAQKFRAAHPDSPHLRRIDSVLAE